MTNVPERFSGKVTKNPQNGCFEWRAGRNAKGYGRYQTGVKTGVKLAHRLAYEWLVGPIPPGMEVCHSCDNPACVNPDHLFVGDRNDNMQDAARKGRVRGQGRVPLSSEQVLEIRGASLPHKELAEKYGRTVSAIEKIRAGTSYAWIN